MKTAVLLASLASLVSVQALSSCILSCQTSAASDSGCGTDYNTTTCYCSGDFSDNVKACLYSNDCDDDLAAFYSNVDSFCDGDEESGNTASEADETLSSVGGWLGSCVLSCQKTAASEAGCSSSYNDTSCYCDNEDFATDTKACLYENCEDYVSIFYNYRSSICGTANSSEYESELATATARPSDTIVHSSIAEAAAATASSTTKKASTASATAAAATTTNAAASVRGLAGAAVLGVAGLVAAGMGL